MTKPDFLFVSRAASAEAKHIVSKDVLAAHVAKQPLLTKVA